MVKNPIRQPLPKKEGQVKFSTTTSPPRSTGLAYSLSNGQDEENHYRFKEHHEKKELATGLTELGAGKPEVTPWCMPDSLARKGAKGRVHMGGVPRSNFEMSERLGKILGREIVRAIIENNFGLNGLTA